MRFVMAGGGTGGHVIPAIAVARELVRAGQEVLFVGTERGVEARLVPAAGFRLEKIRVGGLKNLGFSTKFVSAWRAQDGSDCVHDWLTPSKSTLTPSTPFAFTSATVFATAVGQLLSVLHMVLGNVGRESPWMIVRTTFVPCACAVLTRLLSWLEFHTAQPESFANVPSQLT